MVKYAGNGRLDRRVLNRGFGQTNARPDDECWELEALIINTMSGCGWDCKGVYDFLMFSKEFNIPWSVWRHVREGSVPTGGKSAVFEKRDGVPMWTWFEKSMQIAEWVAVDQDCPVTKKLVPFKNGFFKTQPL